MLTLLLLTVVSCSAAAPPPEASAAAVSEPAFDRGIADLYPKSNSEVRGTLVFRRSPDGLLLKGSFDGLEGGRFAVSVHEGADCSSHDAKSVGAVFNPSGAEPPAGLVGDAVAKAGARTAEVELVLPSLGLEGKDSILGHAVVVHAWPTDPEVNWERVPFLACGVIEGG